MNRADRHAAWLGVGVFLASLVFLAGAMPGGESFLTDRDQGNQLAKATQIALGRHPFIDFRNGVYGPLIFYTSHLGQLLSGGRALGEAVILLVGYASAYTILFFLLRSTTRQTSTAIGLVVLAMLLVPRFYKYYIVLGPLLFVAGLRRVLLRPLGARSLVGLAAVTDVAGLYRLDFGVYAVATATLCIALAHRSAARTALPRYAGWCLLFASPWLLFLAIEGNPLRIIAESIQMAQGVAAGLALETPRLSRADGLASATNRFVVAFWYVRAVPVFAVLWIAATWRRFTDPRERIFGLGLALFGALVFLQASHRVGLSHLLQVLPVQLLLLAWLAARVAGDRPARRRLVPALCALFVLPVALLVDAPQTWTSFDLGGGKLRGLSATAAQLREPGRWPARSSQHLIASVARSLHDSSDPGAGVLVLPFEPQLYWLADRGFTTSFGWINPGRFPDRAAQESFVLSMGDTRVVADWSTFQFVGSAEPDARGYADLLMRHVYERYAIFRQLGSFFVLTDDPAVLARASAFPAQFRLPERPIAVAPEPSASQRVTRVNTLATSPGTMATSIRGGGLALRIEAAGDPLAAVALRRDGLVFVADPGLEPRPAALASHPTIIELTVGTGELAAGSYDVLLLSAAPGQTPVAHDTGQDVRLSELEPLRR